MFVGFGIAAGLQVPHRGAKLWSGEPAHNLYTKDEETGAKAGIKGAEVRGELAPELLGVGFLIGPRIACLMMAGAVLSYFVLGPAIATFGEQLNEQVAPAKRAVSEEPGHLAVAGGLVAPAVEKARDADPGLIRNMEPDDIRGHYLKLTGAGAVAAGGIISMFRRCR